MKLEKNYFKIHNISLKIKSSKQIAKVIKSAEGFASSTHFTTFHNKLFKI
jgi:hypothetical protein